VTHDAGLLEDLLDLGLRERDVEVLAELHELAQVNLGHGLLELFELATLRDVLARVEVEDLLDATTAKFMDVQDLRSTLVWRVVLELSTFSHHV
jgi:hypothetical protein